MRTRFGALIIIGLLLSLGAPATAQAPPAPPADFQLIGSLDIAVALGSDPHPVVGAGWIFDCRSGLRPVLERVGSVSMKMVHNPDGVPVFPSVRVEPSPMPRTDVLAAYSSKCPSMGAYTGYFVIADMPPPPGWYTVTIAWATWDGTGRQIKHVSRPYDVVVP